jgi:glucosamine--fructose-6-phosphate aminotransferase (isomerizing)
MEPSTDAAHDPNRHNRVKLTRKELLEQPTVLQDTLKSIERDLEPMRAKLGERTITKLYIVGCGDSWFAGIGVRHALEILLNIPCEPMQALDFALYSQIISEETAVIGLSASGTTGAVVDSLRRAKEMGAFTIGLSNTEGSLMLTEFDGGIFVPAQRKGWPTQASTAAMVALILFAIRLNETWNHGSNVETSSLLDSLELLPEQVEKVITNHDETMKKLAEKYVLGNYFMLTGAGPYFASASFGAAKLKELCPLHAVAMPLEEFHHYRTCKENDILFVVAPDDVSRHRAKDTVDVGTYDGGNVIVLTNEQESYITEFATDVVSLPKTDERLAPILFSIPLQLFAYHLAMYKYEKRIGYAPTFSA